MDPATGEMLEGVVPLLVRRNPGGPVDPFFLARQAGLKRLALAELSHDARRVLLLMMAHLEYDNRIALTQPQAREMLGFDKSRVSRAVRCLVAAKVIEADGKSGRYVLYRLNSDIGWKGKREDWPR